MDFKHCKVLADDVLNESEIYSQIFVYNKIPESAHLLPGNIGSQLLGFHADPACGFCEDLKVAKYRILDQSVGHKRIAAI